MVGKVVQGEAFDRMGVNANLLRPPLEAVTVGLRNPGAPPEDEETEERDVAVSEVFGKPVRLLEIVE